MQVFFIRGTKMIGGDHFALDGAKDEPDAEVMDSFLKQFYESADLRPAARCCCRWRCRRRR